MGLKSEKLVFNSVLNFQRMWCENIVIYQVLTWILLVGLQTDQSLMAVFTYLLP